MTALVSSAALAQRAPRAKPKLVKRAFYKVNHVPKSRFLFFGSPPSGYTGPALERKLAVSLPEHRAEILVEQAKIYSRAGISDSFVSSMRRAFEYAANHEASLAAVTSAAAVFKDPELCQQAADLASGYLARHPTSHSAMASRATAKGCLGDLLGAFEDLTRAISLEPNNREYLLARRNIPHRLEDTGRALELHQLIIDHDRRLLETISDRYPSTTLRSSLASGYISRSFTYAKRGDVVSQLADLTAAVEIFPETALPPRASAYIGLKRFDDAIADATTYLEITAKRHGKMGSKAVAYEYMRRAHIYITAGRYDKAIADFETALRLDPDRKDAIEKLIANARAKQAQSPK